MSLLFETIKILNRTPFNLEGHNRRVASSRRELLDRNDIIDLSNHILIPPEVGNGLYRCRLLYGTEVESVDFFPYTVRSIQSVRLVKADHVRYNYKFRDRSHIDSLLRQAGTDEILMVVNGEVTDLSFANIAFFDGERWITPSRPMLSGTKRQLLLDQGILHTERIAPKDLQRFTKAAPINAMLDIGDMPFLNVKSFVS